MDILHEYFLVPLMRNGWFNPVNSLAYGISLVIGIWLVFNVLKKAEVPVDRGLFTAVLPFIAFAGVTRTMRDYIYLSSSGQPGFLSSFSAYMDTMQYNAYEYVFSATGNSMLAGIDSYVIAWFPTPGSYFITFLLAIFSLFTGLVIRHYKGMECWKTMFVMGSIFFAVNASLVPVITYTPLIYIGSVTLAWAALFFTLARPEVTERIGKASRRLSEFVKGIFTPINSSILSAHFFDATATFFAIAVFTTAGGHGYTEQHFLSRWLMPFLGPQVMFLLKFMVIVPVLYYIDRYTAEDRELSRFLKLVVFILGAAPAARNLVRLMAGV
jgi:uncharacterized membrane protein